MSEHGTLLHALFEHAAQRGTILRLLQARTDVGRYLPGLLCPAVLPRRRPQATRPGSGDRVGILSTNRVEWLVGDLGILGLGAVSVPIYPNSIPVQVEYI